MNEVVGLRTYTSKTFGNGSGLRRLEAHIGHIHYKDVVGDFRDVDLTFEDQGTYFLVTKASYRLYVSKAFDVPDLIRFDNRYEGAFHSIYYAPHSIWWVNTDDKSERTKWKDRQAVTGTLNAAGNQITWANAFGAGVDFQVTLYRSGFTKEIVINSKPPTGAAPYTNWALGVVFRWTADNLTVKALGGSDWDDLTYYEHTGQFEVREAGGAKSYIQAAYGIDSAEKRKELAVFYEKKGGFLWQGKLIPSSFIEQATYPARMDTSTSYYAGAGDGYVHLEDEPDWDTCHDAATGTGVAFGGQSDMYVQVNTGYTIRRVFLPIDTSALPDDATISAAALYTFVKTKLDNDNDANAWITVVQTSQPDPTQLTTADYDLCGDSIDNPTEGTADRKDITAIPVVPDQYINWVLNATGRGWISKTGYTLLGLREGHDCVDDAPDGRNNLFGYTSERAGTSQDPYLSVTYTVPTSIPVMMRYYRNVRET